MLSDTEDQGKTEAGILFYSFFSKLFSHSLFLRDSRPVLPTGQIEWLAPQTFQ